MNAAHYMNPITDATKNKHELLRRYLEFRTPLWGKSTKHLVFVEPTPGTGEGCGSPIILNEYLKWWVKNRRGGTAMYYANDDGFADKEKTIPIGSVLGVELLKVWSKEHWSVSYGTSSEKALSYPMNLNWHDQHGVLFVDPCCGFKPNGVRSVLGDAPNMDVFINITTTQLARHNTHDTYGSMIREWKDRQWYMTVPDGQQQWVRVLGTTKKADWWRVCLFEAFKHETGKAILVKAFSRNYNKSTRSEISKKASDTRKRNLACRRNWNNKNISDSAIKMFDGCRAKIKVSQRRVK